MTAAAHYPARRIPLAIAALSLACTIDGSDRFLCGVKVNNGSDVAVCDRPHEVCVCATNSCAVAVPTGDCASGLRYVEAPFAAPGLAGSCVVADEAASAISATSSNSTCSANAQPAGGGAS